MIAAGGTGGGVYPALAIAKEFLTADRAEILWIGSRGGMESDLVPREHLPFKSISAAGVHGVGWRKLPGNALALVRGFFESQSLVRAFKPGALLVTGGFLAGPVSLACRFNGVPVCGYLPDLEPGLALKVVATLAARICVTAEVSREFFAPHKTVVTGYPVRAELAAATRAGGIEHFRLDPQRKTILITGGSRGARSLNRATFAALDDWLRDFQVIHLSGTLDWAEAETARSALSADRRLHYHALPFLHEMGLALAAADVVVSRAGASALGEYPLFGLPAVLVPYPFAWRYQKTNADFLVARGAAIRVNDEDLGTHLRATVRNLLSNEARLQQMRLAAQAAAHPEAAQRIAQELVTLAADRA